MDIRSKRQTMIIWSVLAIIVSILTIVVTCKYLNMCEGLRFKDLRAILGIVIGISSICLIFTLFNLVAMWLNVSFFKSIYNSIIGCSIILIILFVVMMAVTEIEFLDYMSPSDNDLLDESYLGIAADLLYFRYMFVFRNIPIFLIVMSVCNIICSEMALKVMEYKESIVELNHDENINDNNENIEVKDMKNKIRQAKKIIKINKLKEEYNKLVGESKLLNTNQTVNQEDEKNNETL